MNESQGYRNSVLVKLTLLPTYKAVKALICGTLGAALVNFPFIYYMFGGWPSAILVQATLSVIICGSLIILAVGTHKSGVNNFFGLLAFYIGPKISVFVQIFTVIFIFGMCVTHIIILKDQVFAGLLQFFQATHAWYASDKFVTFIISFILFYPFLLTKKLVGVGYSRLALVITTLYLTGAVIGKYYSSAPLDKIYKPSISINWTGAFETVGALIFCFQNHISSVSVFHDNTSTRLSRYILASVLSTLLCNITYILFGIYGSLSFGSYTKDDILLNYLHTDIVLSIGRVMFGTLLQTSYTISAYDGRITLHKLLNLSCLKLKSYCGTSSRVDDDEEFIASYGDEILINNEGSNANYKPNYIAWFLSGTLWFIFSYVAAMFTPGISTALGYLGSAATIYTMVIPGWCLIKITHKDGVNFCFLTKLLNYIIGIFYISLGIVMGIVILYKSIKKGSL